MFLSAKILVVFFHPGDLDSSVLPLLLLFLAILIIFSVGSVIFLSLKLVKFLERRSKKYSEDLSIK